MSMAILDANLVQEIIDCTDADALLAKFVEMDAQTREQLVRFLRRARGVNLDPESSTSLTDAVEAIIDAEDADAVLQRFLELPDDTREQVITFFKKARNARVNVDPAPAQPAAPAIAVQPLSSALSCDWEAGWSAEDWLDPVALPAPPPCNARKAVMHLNRVNSSDPADRFIDGSTILIRQLRGLRDRSDITRDCDLEPHHEYNEENEWFFSDERVEATLSCPSGNVRLVIFAPGVDGAFAKLCARIENGHVIRGKVSQETWNRIAAAIQVDAVQPPPLRQAPPPSTSAVTSAVTSAG
jgi:uncharacterized protein YfcZ (UPF0381/DUF406 family)